MTLIHCCPSGIPDFSQSPHAELLSQTTRQAKLTSVLKITLIQSDLIMHLPACCWIIATFWPLAFYKNIAQRRL